MSNTRWSPTRPLTLVVMFLALLALIVAGLVFSFESYRPVGLSSPYYAVVSVPTSPAPLSAVRDLPGVATVVARYETSSWFVLESSDSSVIKDGDFLDVDVCLPPSPSVAPLRPGAADALGFPDMFAAFSYQQVAQASFESWPWSALDQDERALVLRDPEDDWMNQVLVRFECVEPVMDPGKAYELAVLPARDMSPSSAPRVVSTPTAIG